jgi:hypothetical protein
MISVFVLVAVLLSGDGKIEIETFQYPSAEACREGANALKDFLKSHDVAIVSGAWGCTQWELIAPPALPLAPKSESSMFQAFERTHR